MRVGESESCMRRKERARLWSWVYVSESMLALTCATVFLTSVSSFLFLSIFSYSLTSSHHATLERLGLRFLLKFTIVVLLREGHSS